MLETIVAISLGVGLAAACGFRVFVPMLVAAVAAKAELLTVADGFEWLSSWPAITALGIATAAEIGAYYFPWLDNLLDSVSAPAAVTAGVVLTAAFVHDMHPLWKWSLALIAGGGSAGVVKAGLAAIRLGSTAVTGGTANPLVSTVEWMVSVALSILSVFVPILAAILGILLVAYLLRFALQLVSRLRGRRGPQADSAK